MNRATLVNTAVWHVLYTTGAWTITVGYWLKCRLTSPETVRLLGTGAQDVHLDFHTAAEFCVIQDKIKFSVALRLQRLYGLLGTGAQDGHLDFNTAPER